MTDHNASKKDADSRFDQVIGFIGKFGDRAVLCLWARLLAW